MSDNKLSINDEMERVEKASLELIYKVLRTDSPDDGLLERTRIGQAAFSAIQRRRQSDGAREALHFAMARSITQDPEALATYIRVTNPDSAIVKALPGGKDTDVQD